MLIYSDRREIRLYRMRTKEARTIIPDLTNAIGLDFDWKEQMVYWSDVNEDRIERAFLNGTGRTAIVSSGLIAPEGRWHYIEADFYVRFHLALYQILC